MSTQDKLSWMVIVNPKAGLGHGLKDWPIISNQLNRSGVEFTCVFTEKKYHAVELTVKAINDGYRKIIIVGGDGTVNEVVNGIFIQKIVHTTNIKLAVIPAGTGNDWVRMYGIPKAYNEAVKAVVLGRTILQDVGLITYQETMITHKRYMANVAGIGFDAMVNRCFNRLKDEGRNSKWLYVTSLIKTLFKYRSKQFKINVDNHEFYNNNMFSATVGIGKYNGGGMLQMPAAVVDDGLFDITVIKNLSKFGLLWDIKKLYNGRIYKHPKVIATQAKRIVIESTPESPIEIDGEALGYSPFSFELVPQSICVIVGDKYKKD